MRVALLGPYPNPGQDVTGGVQKVIDTLAPIIGAQVELRIFAPSARLDAVETRNGVEVEYIRRAPGPGGFRYWTLDARRVKARLEAWKPDIVHVQGKAGFYASGGYPALFTLHGFADRDFIASGPTTGLKGFARRLAAGLLRYVEDRARNRMGNVVVINPYVREALPDVNRNQTFDICNPIDPIFCDALPDLSGERPRHILSVGRVGPRKNTLETIRIAVRVMQDDPKARLLIFGDVDRYGDYQARCEAVASEAGVADRVEFCGNVDAERLRTELDAASLLLMTSRQETAPLVISEANARGVAVVAPEAFGIRHMIKPGVNGHFLPETGGLEAQAATLRTALDTPWRRAELSAMSLDAHHPDKVAARTLDAYRTILGLTPTEHQTKDEL